VLLLSSSSLNFKVVVGFGLLEGRLPVLADHDERRQEDRFKRNHIVVDYLLKTDV
jgi:hypothetical protein